MDHGPLYMNITDAVAEGDGDRIIWRWKFLLLHFFSDQGSTKYTIKATPNCNSKPSWVQGKLTVIVGIEGSIITVEVEKMFL